MGLLLTTYLRAYPDVLVLPHTSGTQKNCLALDSGKRVVASRQPLMKPTTAEGPVSFHAYGVTNKWAALVRIIARNGGPFKSLYKIWRYDTLKEGMLKGVDCFGNRYYENTYYMLGRSRWVEYSDHVRWNYDASQVPPEWFGWLHYKTDCLPSEDCAKYCLNCCSWCHRWLLPHQENMSGTECAYYPYSTTRQHIRVWDGQSICNRPVC